VTTFITYSPSEVGGAAVAQCPTGKWLIGGGVELVGNYENGVGGAAVSVLASGPVGLDTWRGEAREDGLALWLNSWSMRVSVICVDSSSISL
jgi:hypothetical protein